MNPKISVFLEIFLVGLGLVGLWFFLSWNNAHAEITRDELEELKINAETSEANLKQVTREIIDIKIDQRNLKDTLSKKIKVLENTRLDARTDWNAISQIEVIEDQIDTLEKVIDSNNIRLQELEDLKKQYEVSSINDKDQYENTLNLYKIENTFDPSGYTKLIGITLSEGCLELIRNNFNHTCPTYEDLMVLDSSKEEYSGFLGIFDGMFKRGPEVYSNSHRAYDYDPQLRIIVDPPADHRKRIKMITIENNFQTYFVPNIDNKLHNNTRTYHELRWTEGCHNAQISTFNWTSILPDTINYLRTGCEQTGFNEMKFEYRNSTEWNPSDSPGWHYRNWLEQVKIDCKGLCISTSSDTRVD